MNYIDYDWDRWVLWCKEKEIDCDLLIVADGWDSKISIEDNVKQYVYNHFMNALAFTIVTDKVDKIAYQSFQRNSIIAILPIENNVCSVIWSCDMEIQ